MSISLGKSVIKIAQRLKFKESDRLDAMAENLAKIGVKVRKLSNWLEILGTKKLHGGMINGLCDHRIVMAMAISSIFCDAPLTILGAEVVNKSYPNFFQDFVTLGGKIYVI
jgi:3-phosphoshikimate 1-carboxyvinyltransferase